MKRRLIEVIRGETGQALPIVLVLMLLGGLLIAPSLSYASTSLNAGQVVEKKVNGLYAADAGIEHALWKLKNDLPVPESYPLPEETVNQMQVAIETEDKGTYTLYFGELRKVVEHPQEPYYWLVVEGEMKPIGEETYEYTIRVTWQPDADGNIFLKEIGVRLPVGYSYQPGTAASFFGGELVSTDDPVDDPIEQDQAGAYMPVWEFEMGPPPLPEVTEEYPTATQTFYVTGEGGQEGDYTWAVARRTKIGIVGEVIGTLYRITATATRPEDVEDGDPTATVVADAIVKETEAETEICVILWQINPPEE